MVTLLNRCNRDHLGLRILKYLLFGPLKKNVCRPPLPTLEHFAVLEQCFQNFNVHESLEDLVTEQILIQ